MATLKRHREAPPGGFQYFQRETEFTIKAESLGELVDLIIAHRKYKNLHPQDYGNVQLEAERQMCIRLGRLECKPEGRTDKWVPQDNMREHVTMGDVLTFSKAALAFIASGGELAPIEEVERRAKICKTCPLNQPMSGCSCGLFYKAIDATVPRARRLDGLHVCRVCHCSLTAKANLPDNQVAISNEGKDYKWPEQECWQKAIMAQVSKPQ